MLDFTGQSGGLYGESDFSDWKFDFDKNQKLQLLIPGQYSVQIATRSGQVGGGATHAWADLETIAALRANGVEFLAVPEGYYDTVWDRVGEVKEDKGRIKDLGILVDHDEKGYLLQLFTRPLQDRPTLFIEIIQRRGSDSFGKGNFKALFETIEQEQGLRGNL